MEVVVVLVVMVIAVVVVVGPLRPRWATEERATQSAERAELEAAKEAKLREIREAELDHRLGKLSDADWRAQDAALREEAVALLRRLDAVAPAEGGRQAQEDG
jgi:hypothetical protein